MRCFSTCSSSDMAANLPTGADLPPPESGPSQSQSQDTMSLTPTVPPPREFSALPTRRSTIAGVGHSRARRPAPLPPVETTRRVTTGKGIFHRSRSRDTVSSTSLRRKLIVISSPSTEETDEAPYCNVTSPERATDVSEGSHDNSGWNKELPSPQGSPQYEIMVHPSSFSLQDNVSASKLLTQDVSDSSHKSDNSNGSTMLEITSSKTRDQT